MYTVPDSPCVRLMIEKDCLIIPAPTPNFCRQVVTILLSLSFILRAPIRASLLETSGDPICVNPSPAPFLLHALLLLLPLTPHPYSAAPTPPPHPLQLQIASTSSHPYSFANYCSPQYHPCGAGKPACCSEAPLCKCAPNGRCSCYAVPTLFPHHIVRPLVSRQSSG